MLRLHLDPGVDAASRNVAFIDRSVAWIISHFGVRAGTRIADFGCGPGLYTTRLARAGAGVTGIDFSHRSLRYARQVAGREGLRIQYVHQDYLQFETDQRFQLIMMIMCDFCALSPVQRARMLVKFFDLLAPGGHVLLDVYSLAAFEARQEAVTYAHHLMDGFWSPHRYYGFLNTYKYEPQKVLLDKYTIVESDRTRTVYNWLQCFSPQALEDELAACGFNLDGFYGDVAGASYDPQAGEFAVIVTRP
jgi:2-polyprenyl-3-methyl-5-hydroxy-6-metoxy-1,4-benzoquinol methylase